MTTESVKPLTLDQLRLAMAGGAVAVRAVNRLEPAGGPHDKVFPPTYTQENKAPTKYALETRRINEEFVPTVLLDSVPSQANRIEESLLEAWNRSELKFPLVRVDFSAIQGLEDLQTISALQAPHRIADAILRDSFLGDKPFRLSDVGKAITDSNPNHSTAMYKYCPTALLFGVWDSTGPKGGMGSKFQRALVSEIVGINAVIGVKTASRLDPLQIVKGVEIFQAKNDAKDWTLDPKEAATDKGKPILYSRKGDKGKGSPSAINHSNIPPSIDASSGGVTIDYALQTIVLSLPALRRLRFNNNVAGEALVSGAARDAAENSARTALAALALAGVVLQHERGYDLRSRSLLVATAPFVFELLQRDGSPAQKVSLDSEQAMKLVADAEAEARTHGFGWLNTPINLKPSNKLSQLILRSRQLSAAGAIEDEEAN
jgi:CRISPR-associated protein Csb1